LPSAVRHAAGVEGGRGLMQPQKVGLEKLLLAA